MFHGMDMSHVSWYGHVSCFMVWTCLMFRRTCEDNLVGGKLQKRKKERQTKEGLGMNIQEWVGYATH